MNLLFLIFISTIGYIFSADKICFSGVTNLIAKNTNCKNEHSIACADIDFKEGWHILRINSCNNTIFDYEQISFAAGYLEGYIYKKEIDYAFQNINSTMWDNKDFNEKIQNFVEEQFNYVSNLAKRRMREENNNEGDLFNENNENIENKLFEINLFQKKFLKINNINIDKSLKRIGNHSKLSTIHLILQQYNGMFSGYSANGGMLPKRKFYYLTMLGELSDIATAMNNKHSYPEYMRKQCSILVKLLDNNIIISHNTHNIYSLMLRIYKEYNLNLVVNGKKLNNMRFTSRPGDLNSKDDYYTLDNNMVVMETSLAFPDPSVYKSLNTNTIPKWIRTHLANRLAENGSEWIDYFHYKNSGTHNDQWIIVDINRYKSIMKNTNTNINLNINTNNLTGVVYLTDQTPFLDKIYSVDMSDVLFEQSWVASFNKPYFREVYEKGGYLKHNITDYYHDLRYNLFNKYNANVTNIEEMKKLIRYHDKSSMCNTISPRCDLVQDWAFGGVDAKVTDINLMEKGRSSLIISGPSFIEGLSTPFKFSGSKYKDVSHLGIQDFFNNSWIEV